MNSYRMTFVVHVLVHRITEQLDTVYTDENSALDRFFIHLQADTLIEEVQ